MWEWYSNLPTWAKIAIPVALVGIIVVIWQPWKASSSSGSSGSGVGTSPVPVGTSPVGVGTSPVTIPAPGMQRPSTGRMKSPGEPSSNIINLATPINPVKAPRTAQVPKGNTPFASSSELAKVAAVYGIPLRTNTRGRVAVFYAGNNNGVPQIAKYGATGAFLGTYAAPNLPSIPSVGSIAGGVYRAPGTYQI